MADSFLFLIPLLAALPFLAIASYFDIKSSEIPDWLSYSFICSGAIILAGISVAVSSWAYLINGGLGFAVCLVLGLAFYYLRFWGGGDAKLLFGIGFFFGNLELLAIAISILIALAVYLLIGLLISFSKYKNEIQMALMKKSIIWESGVYFVIPLVFAVLFYIFIGHLLGLLVGAFTIFVYIFFNAYIFTKMIERAVFIKRVPVSRLRLEDWPAEEIKVKSRIISKNCLGLTKQDIGEIKAAGIREVLIKTGLPFAPAFLLFGLMAVIIAVI